MTDVQLVILVAMARNRVIGAGGALPWKLPTDLRRYRALTMGKPMIMGRRTQDSIGRVLDGRDSIVLTGHAERVLPGALHAAGLEEALELAGVAAARRGAGEIVVIGGEQVFELFLPRASRIEMTLVECEPAGDTRFPALGSAWRTIADEPMARSPADSAPARFMTLARGGGDAPG